DWLSFVRSPRARNKIRQWFTKERREEAIEAGRTLIAKQLRKQNLPIQRILSHDTLVALADEMRYADVSALYAAVGEGHVSAANVVNRLVASLGGESGTEEDLAEATTPGRPSPRARHGSPAIVVKGMEGADTLTKLARCCTPVPGDDIVGFVTRGSGISVHRSDCANVESLRQQPERMLEVEWAKDVSSMFLVQIQVEALDRNGLLSDVTKVLSDNHVNILSANVATTRDRVALSRFVFEMAEPSHLGHVLRSVRQIDGVFDVFRPAGAKTQPAPPPLEDEDCPERAGAPGLPTSRYNAGSPSVSVPRVPRAAPGRGTRAAPPGPRWRCGSCSRCRCAEPWRD